MKARSAASFPRISFIPKRIRVNQSNKNNPKTPLGPVETRESELTLNADRLPNPHENVWSPTETQVQITNLDADELQHPPKDSPTDLRSHSALSVQQQLNALINKQKNINRAGIVIGIMVLCAVGAVVPIVLVNVLPKEPARNSSYTTSSPVAVCSTQTCIGSETPYRTSVGCVLYPFDTNANDLTGQYPGVTYGSSAVVYSSVSTYLQGCIDLDINNVQFVRIPNVNFQRRSFTIQMWFLIKGSGNNPEYGLLSQCDSGFNCLLLSIRDRHVTLSLDSMNVNTKMLVGGATFSQNTWYHVTAVYNALIGQQSLYVNGRLDAVSYGKIEAFQGSPTNAKTYIGITSSYNYSAAYFYGYMDHVIISPGTARTACQIFNDASLIAYFPFDTLDPLLDRSVNLLHGIASGVTLRPSGRVQQAITFNSNTSYFQAPCFPTVRATSSPYSISLWVNPTVVVGGGTLVHVSSLQGGNGSLCYDLLGFSATGVLIVQNRRNVGLNVIESSVLPLNTWTHIAVIKSDPNDLRLYINSRQAGTVTVNMEPASTNNYITLGNNSPGTSMSPSACLPTTNAPGPFKGSIDDFRVYNRELSLDELCVLTNM